MKPLIAVLAAAHLLGALSVGAGLEAGGSQPKPLNWTKIRLLVYTKNGTGYVHDNIPASIEAIRACGAPD